MSEPVDSSPEVFLTEEEVARRYRNKVSPGTLRNWRSLGRGPAFIKVGRTVLYPLAALRAWEGISAGAAPDSVPDAEGA